MLEKNVRRFFGREENGKIIIERTKPSTRQNIYELFDGYKGKYEPSEIDWGDPSGREIW